MPTIPNDKLTYIPNSLFEVPESLVIKNSHINGLGVFATKDIKAGDTLYEADFIILPLEEEERVISFRVPSLKEEIIHVVSVHGVFSDGKWKYYGFDSCTNHSCFPNTFSIRIGKTKYKTIALHNIKSEEEIFCNYNFFIWEMPRILICNCHSKNCLGQIYGFKNLPIETQKMLLPFFDCF